MAREPLALRYIITKRAPSGSVHLSKSGHWGNMPFDDVFAAERAARADADGKPFSIERETR